MTSLMLRLVLTALLAHAPLLSSAQAASKATGACRTEEARHDRIDLRCPWPAGAQRLRIEAHLAGSHDDTTAALAVSVDGRPIDCAAGSKTTIEGLDEGDVTLHCQLSAPPAAAHAPVLRVQLSWYHARHTGFEVLVLEPRP